jgi:hypothetical protein
MKMTKQKKRMNGKTKRNNKKGGRELTPEERQTIIPGSVRAKIRRYEGEEDAVQELQQVLPDTEVVDMDKIFEEKPTNNLDERLDDLQLLANARRKSTFEVTHPEIARQRKKERIAHFTSFFINHPLHHVSLEDIQKAEDDVYRAYANGDFDAEVINPMVTAKIDEEAGFVGDVDRFYQPDEEDEIFETINDERVRRPELIAKEREIEEIDMGAVYGTPESTLEQENYKEMLNPKLKAIKKDEDMKEEILQALLTSETPIVEVAVILQTYLGGMLPHLRQATFLYYLYKQQGVVRLQDDRGGRRQRRKNTKKRQVRKH